MTRQTLLEQTLRNRIGERVHLIASAIQDGSIDIRHLDIFMLAMPTRFIPRSLYRHYERWRIEYGTVPQYAATGIANNETGNNAH